MTNFQREHRAAVRCFSWAYKVDPSLRKARLDRGIIFFREMGLLDAALADFDALLVEDGCYGPALLNRAMLAQERGQYTMALADLEAYLDLPKEDEEYWRIASRTANILREILSDIDSSRSPGPIGD